MAALRFADIRFRPTEFLDFTSLTLDEFQILVAPFEAAFQVHMIGWRLDGAPRTARRWDRLKFGGQAAIASCGCVSLAGRNRWNLCP
jgi:hypothetical protein